MINPTHQPTHITAVNLLFNRIPVGQLVPNHVCVCGGWFSTQPRCFYTTHGNKYNKFVCLCVTIIICCALPAYFFVHARKIFSCCLFIVLHMWHITICVCDVGRDYVDDRSIYISCYPYIMLFHLMVGWLVGCHFLSNKQTLTWVDK